VRLGEYFHPRLHDLIPPFLVYRELPVPPVSTRADLHNAEVNGVLWIDVSVVEVAQGCEDVIEEHNGVGHEVEAHEHHAFHVGERVLKLEHLASLLAHEIQDHVHREKLLLNQVALAHQNFVYGLQCQDGLAPLLEVPETLEHQLYQDQQAAHDLFVLNVPLVFGAPELVDFSDGSSHFLQFMLVELTQIQHENHVLVVPSVKFEPSMNILYEQIKLNQQVVVIIVCIAADFFIGILGRVFIRRQDFFNESYVFFGMDHMLNYLNQNSEILETFNKRYFFVVLFQTGVEFREGVTRDHCCLLFTFVALSLKCFFNVLISFEIKLFGSNWIGTWKSLLKF